MIVVGEAVVQGNKVVIKPATLGFGAVRAVRLTNYTANVLVLTNISGQDQSQEYLLPLQQMVYESINASGVPTVDVKDIGASITAPPTVLVEWSTDPIRDFTGNYPTVIGEPSGAPYAYITQESVNNDISSLDFFNYMSIGANPFRKALTVINNTNPLSNDSALHWSYNTDSFEPASPILAPTFERGSGRTILSTAAVYFGGVGQSGGGDLRETTLEIIEESWGAPSPITRSVVYP